MKPVRWGVLGNARFARDHMAPAIHMAENAELVALATSNPGHATGWDFHPGLKQVSYDDLLADPSIDAIYIPLPNHIHVEWTLKAIAAGKHVLTEKPISMTAAERHPRHRGLYLWLGPLRLGGRGRGYLLPHDPREWRRCLGAIGWHHVRPAWPRDL